MIKIKTITGAAILLLATGYEPEPKLTPRQQYNIVVGKPKRSIADIYRDGYYLRYDKVRKTPLILQYRLTPTDLEPQVKRKKNFLIDPVLKRIVTHRDFKGSGLDRGHLVPSRDLLYSMQSQYDGAFLGNISPQIPEFNRGVWLKLENYVREIVMKTYETYIVVGVITSPNHGTIGENNIYVTEYFFKAVMWHTDLEEWGGIGWIMPHKEGLDHFSEYETNIDSIEMATGFDLFHKLPDRIEYLHESKSSVPNGLELIPVRR